ncbi:unnamed protein product [Ectocarpus sp. CCAP 1310/34]|nr:unnamed protein product [Ectocarpus sp. CCAP 1310/34]
MVAASKAKKQQPVVVETEPKIETTVVDDQIDNSAALSRVNLSSRQSHGGEESHGVPLGIRSGGEGKNPDPFPAIGQDQLDEEAAVGSIHHILKTAFKELYDGGSDNDETEDEAAEEGNGRQGTPANGSDSESRRPSSVAMESAANGGGADEGELAMTSDGEMAFQNFQRNTSPGGRKLEEGGTAEDTAAIEEREEIEVLKRQGILIGVHIPMGPSGLVLDRSTIGTFGGFAISLLDAAELARANRVAGLRHSGNLPWNEFSQTKPDGEGGDARFEPPGYLKHTTTNVTREALTLKRSFGRRGERGIQQQLQLEAQRDVERAMSGDTIVTGAEYDTNAVGCNYDHRFILGARLKTRNKALTTTKLLASIPPPGDIDGENGYFLASPSVVEYCDYWVGQTFRAELVLRNISCLKRSFMLLPPSTKYFSLAKVMFPSSEIDSASGVVTGTGEIAPGVRATVLVDFVPDSLGEYHDVISVVTEIGTFEVPIFAHRRRPCLSLPPSGLLHCGGCLLGEGRTLRFRVKNTGGPVRFRLLPRRPSEKPAAAADVHQNGESRGEATAAAVAADDGHHAGHHGGNGSELQGGGATRLDRSVLRIRTDCDETFGSSKLPTATAPDAISRANGGIHFDGNGGHDNGDDRKADFDDSSFNPDGNNGSLEVSLRISSIDGTPVPALQSPSEASSPTSHCQDQQQLLLPNDNAADLGSAVVASPAAISHLLFEPTLLASTCRRRFTLRNYTTGDLGIRWEASDITSAQKRQQRGQKKKSATSRSSSSGDPPSASPTTSATPAGGGFVDIFGTVGDSEVTEIRGSAYADREGADWEPGASAPRNEGRTGDVAAGGIQPSSSLAAGKTAQMAEGLATAPGRGPFVIFPDFAVVPAQGEVSFEVAFSPPGLREVGFQAVAVVQGIPAAALAYHNPAGMLVDSDKVASDEETRGGVDKGAGKLSSGGDGKEGLGNRSDNRAVAGEGRFRLFLRSLDPDGKGCFSKHEFMKGLRAMCPLLEAAAATFVDSATSTGNGEHGATIEFARLDPHDDADSDAEGPVVGVKEALAAVGAELRARISHALGGKGLEELVEGHRKDLPGFQMELRGSGEPVRLSLRPAMLQTPGDHLPYGQVRMRRAQAEVTIKPLAMDFEVCNGSSSPAQFEFDLPGMTVSLSGNDAFTTTSPGVEGDNWSTGCDVDISPAKGVVPAGGSVKCRVRQRAIP